MTSEKSCGLNQTVHIVCQIHFSDHYAVYKIIGVNIRGPEDVAGYVNIQGVVQK